MDNITGFAYLRGGESAAKIYGIRKRYTTYNIQYKN